MQFKAAQGMHLPETRGTHVTLYSWPLPEAFSENQHFETFLGSKLFELYQNISAKLRLSSPKKGPYFNKFEVCKAIISGLGSLNSLGNLHELGISKDKLIKGTSPPHYPDNTRPESLPPDNAAYIYESTLNESKIDDPSSFTPLMHLGLGWRAEKNNIHAYYYLSRAAQICEKYPRAITASDELKVLNVLGNICRDLKLHDKAREYRTQALNDEFFD